MVSNMWYARNPVYTNCTITVGGATSAAADLDKNKLIGIIFPSTFDGTTVTFTASDLLAGTYVSVIASDGNAISFTVAASKFLALTDAQATQLSACRFLKVVAGSSQTTTDTILQLVTIPR